MSSSETVVGTPSGQQRQEGGVPWSARAPSSPLGTVFAVAIAAGAIAMATAALPSPKPGRWAAAPEALGSHRAVATDNADATRVAMQVLREGGDAVDAAAAAALTLGVVSPTASGIGGGGFALVWRAKEQRAYLIDFRETAPAALDVAALDARPLPLERRGNLTGAPGEVAGLHQLVMRFGTRRWADDVAPAASIAEQGFVISPFQRRVSRFIPKIVQVVAPAIGFGALAGAGPLPLGARAVRPELGHTLRLLAANPRALYEGSIADAIVDAVRAHGGPLTLADLAAYAPVERQPLRLNVGGLDVLTMPPPSAGGLMLLQTLLADARLRETTGRGLDRDPLGSARYFHRVAELMRGSLDDRARFVADPSVRPVDVDALLRPERIDARLAMLDDGKTHKPIDLRVDEHGTTHVSIVDDDGDAVALTTTVNNPYGAQFVAGDTGILLNDQLDDFAKSLPGADPGPNAPRPGARPVSSMTPTIILENGLPRVIVGGSGGTRIATSVTLVTLAHLIFHASAGDAVGWPRVHPTAEGTLMVDAELPGSVRDALTAAGETVLVGPTINSVQLITVERAGGTARLTAASDLRKDGFPLAE